ncbi:MAG: prepilin-type N-terminal cleavage/methylation domain-containing protein [Gemmatimonadales bacterium]|nr:prepilin-type N-terminal cleavage/methylation domain-containing protein [Gemmatimonadales bacterium]NIN10618.1 prepilin-type N-terminal cleavage/methylation domain-containing protein [Gemmatimonadales bacterium]NIN49380.1 prepilin-type N-terminal cleavage/methylation domain-containing protein [Gemmatimonadales bacterium]NIP06844.1 prepilin-type N-terminal cleavage/methylation domain-containing protein [Gemmatimonadales bacterium]NIR01518.1 prepilin-type N-terminal cleavage/methylation domain
MAGFTLAEMLLVLVVLGILTSVGYWQMLPALERQRVRRTTAVIAADLQYAQAMAARQRRPVVIIAQPVLKAYLIRDRPGTTVYRQRFFGDETDYMIDAFDVSPKTTVEIFPNGVATATTTFTVSIQDYERHVRLTSAGQVRILGVSES